MGGGCNGAVSGIRQASCTDAESCGLNGVCRSDKTCACDAGWKGSDCSRLDTRPTFPTAGFNAPSADAAIEQAANSSWGGSIVQSGGRFVMFAAQLAEGCGIAAWDATSTVVRASSSTVLGPYEFEEVIKPVFAHEPVAARAGGLGEGGTGPVLLYHIGRGNSTAQYSNCSNCEGGRTPDPRGNCGGVPNFNPPIRLSYADDWSAPASSWREVAGDVWHGDENPSPYVFWNGSVAMQGRGELFTSPHWNSTPYIMNNTNLFPLQQNCGDMQCHGIEDPSNIWRDKRGNFHAVFHDHMMIGGHAFSRDGVTWRYSPSPCFGPDYETTTPGGVRTAWLARRERPHVVVEEGTGRPLALSSGVQADKPAPTWCTGCGTDRTYTLVVPVGPAPARDRAQHQPLDRAAWKTDDHARSYETLTCAPDPEFRPELLNHSWATLPTFWQGAAPELATEAQVQAAAKFSMVVVTLHHGQIADVVAACRRVKLAAPHASCIVYWNVQIVINSTEAGVELQSTRQDWLLRDNRGEQMFPAGRFLTPDYRIKEAGEWFLTGCANATRSGWVDGCNLDGGNEFWYAYSGFLRHDEQFPVQEQQQYVQSFRSALQELQASIPTKVLFLHCEQCVIPPTQRSAATGSLCAGVLVGGPCVSGWCAGLGNGSAIGMNGQAIETFFPSQQYVDILKYMAACGKWFKAYVDSAQQLNCADPVSRGDLLAAWLVGAGDGAFLLCGIEGESILLPDFIKALGEPHGSADQDASLGTRGGMVREFASGTRAIFAAGVNHTARGSGCVRWGDGTVTGQCPRRRL
jgi:hypothetical protein